VNHPTAMQRAGGDRGGIASADELGEKVMRVLAVSDVCERAVLPFDEDAGVHQHVHQEAGLTLGEAERHDGVDAFRSDAVAQFFGSPDSYEVLRDAGIERAPATASSAAVTGESRLSAAGGMAATVVVGEDLDVLVTVASLELVLDAEIGKADVVVAVREVVVAGPFRDFSRVPIGSTVAVGAAAVVFLEKALVLPLEIVLQDHAPDLRA
jgi:hypothetical protein